MVVPSTDLVIRTVSFVIDQPIYNIGRWIEKKLWFVLGLCWGSLMVIMVPTNVSSYVPQRFRQAACARLMCVASLIWPLAVAVVVDRMLGWLV